MKFDPDTRWALAYTHSKPRPFICGGMTATTRSELIARIEKEVCGERGWRWWARKTGAKIIRVIVQEARDGSR